MAQFEFAYLTSTTNPGFMNAPSLVVRPKAPYLVAGVAYDGATTNRPGARLGPFAIRRASQMLGEGWHPHFDVSAAEVLADVGDLALPNTSIDSMRAALEPIAYELLASHHMLWLGGDHSITLPLLRAYRRHHDRPLAIIHFDAHCDTWRDHAGEPSGHGTWVYEALNEGLIDPTLTVQFGIRSAARRETREYVTAAGGLVYTARDLRGLTSPAQLGDVLQTVKTRFAAAGNPLTYLSLDIDCLDPAFAPGTGTPEPGGLTSNQVMTLLEELHGLAWVGMDLCEVSPPFDQAELTSNAAATFIWTYLSAQVARQRPTPRQK